MRLPAGTRVGPYEIVAPLGAGGMGEVYRAHDTKLGRDVALKVLPEAFTLDQDRTARFQREAQVLASLNHPNIAAIYGFEDSGAPPGQGQTTIQALALELVEGPTLADRLEPGPLPPDEAVAIARQIALALEAAHERGIVHRDLKPSNVVVRPDGTVKVLDFGLARAMDAASGQTDTSRSPTITSPAMMTGAGIVLGTAAYMSPEQARGRPADRRADIWAFGVVLFEMLTGQHLFRGETVSDTLAAVLRSDPSWDQLPRSTPVTLRRVLKVCLEKDPKARLQAIGDWTLLLEDVTPPAAPVTRARSTVVAASAAVLATLALLVLAVIHFRETDVPSAPSHPIRLTLTLPAGDSVDRGITPALTVSPDGSMVAYAASHDNATAQLWVRAMDGSNPLPLAGTEGGRSPFFSPNSQWIGFFAQGKLKKVSATGGAVQTLGNAPAGLGGSWAADDTIFYVPLNTSGVWTVTADGGTPREITTLDRGKAEVSHRWPQLLPGGKALLFTVWVGPGWDERSLQLQLLETGERRVLAQGASTGRYVPSGHLVYNRDGAEVLMAQPFDLATLQPTGGPPVSLTEHVWEAGSEGAQFAVSETGTLAYIPGFPRQFERRLVWVDRSGQVEAVPAPPRPYYDPRISPDGNRLAITAAEGTERIWLYDFARPTLTALTTADSSSQSAVWTRDGTRVIYRATRQGFRNVYWKAADGSGDEERLGRHDNMQTPMSLSRDGTHVVFGQGDPTTGSDLWTLSLEDSRTTTAFLRTRASENNASVSPDGRWVAYASNESGRTEIYVQPFPGPGGKTTVSTNGGYEPVWSRDGRELFYRSGDALMVVAVSTRSDFVAGLPRRLFSGDYEQSDTGTAGYDVSPDGRRFLMIQPAQPQRAVTQFNIVLNWFDALRRPSRTTP